MLNPGWAQSFLFLTLLFISGILFWLRLRPVLRAILGSRPEPGFQINDIGKRVWRVLWQVGLQAKVIRERPVAGVAHAFVFWGFCVFALITINHLLAGVNLEVFNERTSFGQVYYWFGAAFALLVILAITVLAVRRFIIRPKWLGPLSRESGIIAGLIALLMITYLAQFPFLPGSTEFDIVWWLHTLTLLAFLPLIPRTKHLHLLLSPVTIFLARSGFSKIPPLEGDDDFGLQTGKDVTKIVALQAFSCVECGRCTEHCPATNTGKVLDPKKIILGVRDYLRDNGAGSSLPLVGKYISKQALFECTSCGACEYQCPVGIQHLPILIGLKRGQVNTGDWNDKYGSKLFVTLEKNGNALGTASSERDQFIQRSQFPIYDGNQEYCLWLGCMGAYDPQGREIITSLTKVMRHLGTTFGVLQKERCTGDPVRRLGNDYLFSQLAEQNLEQFPKGKPAKMLSICPHCVRTVSEDWKEAGANIEIEHHSQYLARQTHRLPQPAKKEETTFHDPCFLGRYQGIYSEPRKVVAHFGKVVDAPRSFEDGFCCGAGGGQMFLGEEKGKRINMERAQELVATETQVIAAACPFCSSMLRDALHEISPTPPKLVDIAQLAAQSLPD